MKRLITSTLAALTLLMVPVLSAVQAQAETSTWFLDVSVPTSPTTKKTLALEYKILATDAENTFDVVLNQNGEQVAAQAINKPFGANGVFNVTMSTPGTYTFEVIATDASDQTQSATRTVTLNAPTVVTTTVVQSTDGSSSDGSNAETASTNGGQSDGNTGGVVSDIAASTDNAGSVQGATDEGKSNEDKSQEASAAKSGSNTVAWWVLAAVAAASAGYYWFIQRAGKGPFASA